MKLNELKLQMREIRKELQNEIKTVIKFNDDKIRLLRPSINITDNELVIRVRLFNENINKRIWGGIVYSDKDNADYSKHSSLEYKRVVTNPNTILDLVKEFTSKREEEIKNILKEYLEIENKLINHIRDNIILKDNMENTDISNAIDMEHVISLTHNLNYKDGGFRLIFPVKKKINNEYRYNHLIIIIQDYSVVPTECSWMYVPAQWGDIVDYLEQLKPLIENFIKEN